MTTLMAFAQRLRAMLPWIAVSCVLAGAPFRSARADDAPVTPTTAAPAATAATVGLLPIHGVAVDLDALPGDGRGSDRTAAQATVALQSLWDSYLKGAGFNVIGFPVDVHDLGERGAIRVARLCTWAKQNNVRLAPNLVGAPEGKPLPADYPQLAAAFVGKVIAELGAAGAPAYAQIMLYQLGRPLNHPASHGPMEAAAASAVLKAAAESVRATEQAALAASGLQASPLLVSVSMDYELIRRGAIAHTPLTDESYQGAAEAASDWLATVLGAAPVEAVAVEWFPGSLSSEGVERMPDLMTRLQADLPGKLLLMDTGFSSAAGSDTAQARFYALALNNLCDLRARQGVDSPFAGILWRNAVDGGGAKPLTAEQIAKQDWGARAKDLDRMWTDPKADSKEARSWLAGIQSNFGLISRASSSGSGLAPKTAFVVISHLETALAKSPQASDALAAVHELVASDGNGGVGTKIKSRLQSAMFGLLDAFLSKTAENLFADEPPPAPVAPGAAAALPDVQIVDVGMLPASGTVNTPISIPVTLFNAGAAPATDAAVYLRDPSSDLAHSNPTVISPGATTTVQLTWTPTRSGRVTGIALEAYCNNDADPQTNRADLGELQVNAGTTPPKPPKHLGDFRGQIGGVLATSNVTTQTAPGFVHITDLSTSMVFATPAPGGGTGSGGGGTGSAGSAAVRMAPAPGTGDGAASSTASRPITPATSAPAPSGGSPVTMTLVNPFATAFHSTVATLRVDGQSIAERTLGTMLPGQSRSVSFTEWNPPHPGAYRVQVDLRGVGPQGKPLTSSATSQVVIVGEGRSVRSMPAPGAPGAPVRNPLATRTLMPLVRPASSQPLPAFGARPFVRPGAAGVRGLVGGAVLGLSANSILLRPFPPVADAPLDVTVQLNNAAGSAAGTAQVRLSVDGEDLGVVSVNVPAAGLAMVNGFRTWTAKAGRHDFHAVVTMGTGRAEASKAVFVSPAGARGFGRPAFGGAVAGGVAGSTMGTAPGTRGFQTGPRPVTPLGGGAKPGTAGATGGTGPTGAPGLKPFARPGGAAGAPDLQLTTAELRLLPPAATAGSSAVVNVTVRNLGSAPAMGGTVLLVLAADGKDVARTQLGAPVPANGMLALQWPITVPAGAWSVTATATVPGDTNPNNNVARAAAATRVMPARSALTSPAVLTPTGK